MKVKTHAEEKEVGQGGMDASSQKSLGIKSDKDVLTEQQMVLVRDIKRSYDLRDFTATNNKYGPASGLSPGERLLRAYKLGLLQLRPKS